MRIANTLTHDQSAQKFPCRRTGGHGYRICPDSGHRFDCDRHRCRQHGSHLEWLFHDPHGSALGNNMPRTNAIEDIAEALRSSGYRSLDQQAKALGLHRSTAWTIIKNKHKIGRLSKKTVNRILANAETPPAVRTAIQRYLAENSLDRSKRDVPIHRIPKNYKS
jgi:hypothetical protein